jgi:uncharacterized protein
MNIDPQLKTLAQEAVSTIMREAKNAKAVVIATEDGFEIASQVESTAQTSRLSAMASSFSALGALVGEESQLGLCNNVIIDAQEGYILILQIRKTTQTYTMCVIAGKEAVIGQVLYFSKQAAALLANA